MKFLLSKYLSWFTTVSGCTHTSVVAPIWIPTSCYRFEGVIYMNIRAQKEELDSVKLGEEIGIGEDSYITMVSTKETPVAPVV